MSEFGTTLETLLAPSLLEGHQAHDGSPQQRAQSLLRNEIDFIPNAGFSDPDVEHEILSDLAQSASTSNKAGRLPADLPAHLARLCEVPLLTADEERNLFRHMNFLKFRANSLRVRLDADDVDLELLERAEEYLRRAMDVRDRIVQANLRLVISVVKKFVTPQLSFDEMLSDGIMTMMHAVDKFDFDRGFRFSTYAYRSIARNAYRTVTDRQKENTRFSSPPDEGFDPADNGSTSAMNEKTWELLSSKLGDMFKHLDRREQFILRGRYALGAHRNVRTFQSLADKLGVSKERVRQLEQRAVAKLRAMAAQLNMDEFVHAGCPG